MNNEQWRDLVSTLFGRLFVAFTELQSANDPGKIKIERPEPFEMSIRVQKVGVYRIYAESDPACAASQYVYL
jgi:hypothetical protein